MPAKILVVDDSELALESAMIALEEAGYRVTALENPLLINSVVTRDAPDLILLDVNMPLLPGDKVVEIARRHGGTFGQIPVVLYSDLPVPHLRERARSCGAAGFIQKTEDEAEFLKAVKRYLPD